MAKGSIRDEQRRDLWKRHLDKWSKSGSTQAEYCRRHKLSAKSFTYWKRRIRDGSIKSDTSREKTAVTFVPVEVKPETQAAADMSTGLVVCREGYRIEIREGFKQEALRQVLRTIGELSC